VYLKVSWFIRSIIGGLDRSLEKDCEEKTGIVKEEIMDPGSR
jgi:hypothetical protein